MLNENKTEESINALNKFQYHVGNSTKQANVSVKYHDFCPETREIALIHVGRNKYPFLSIDWGKYGDKFYMEYSAKYCEIKFSEGGLIIKGIDKIGMKITITVDPIIEE